MDPDECKQPLLKVILTRTEGFMLVDTVSALKFLNSRLLSQAMSVNPNDDQEVKIPLTQKERYKARRVFKGKSGGSGLGAPLGPRLGDTVGFRLSASSSMSHSLSDVFPCPAGLRQQRYGMGPST